MDVKVPGRAHQITQTTWQFSIIQKQVTGLWFFQALCPFPFSTSHYKFSLRVKNERDELLLADFPLLRKSKRRILKLSARIMSWKFCGEKKILSCCYSCLDGFLYVQPTDLGNHFCHQEQGHSSGQIQPIQHASFGQHKVDPFLTSLAKWMGLAILGLPSHIEG